MRQLRGNYEAVPFQKSKVAMIDRALVTGLCAALTLLLTQEASTAVDFSWEHARRIGSEEIVEAIKLQKALGYDLVSTANATRLQAGIFLHLARKAAETDPARRPLRIGHEEYFDAYLAVTGLEREAAPVFVRVPHEYGEDHLIDYKMENVIAQVEMGRSPDFALNITAGWPDAVGAPPKYSYEDHSQSPSIMVVHQQVNSYRILDFGEMIVYDDIRGITGRATSGVLGVIFSIIGEGQAVQTRWTYAKDGLQISRTKARKLIDISMTVTIYPDGTVLPGIPPNRPDIAELEKSLKGELEIVYQPLSLTPVPPNEHSRSEMEQRW